MSYETKDYTGRLFKNDKKEKDTHPDYTGTALIDGVEHFMDAWIKRSESGKTWMSFSFKPKQKQAPAPAPRQAPSRVPSSFASDDPPF
jgi:hypothetical protein